MMIDGFEILSNLVTRHRKIVVLGILGSILAIASFFIVQSVVVQLLPENIKKSQIKQLVSQKMNGRQDFDITQILVESGGWMLAAISSTREGDEGNNALVILRTVDNKLILRFGPGSSFNKADLGTAGVPQAILDSLYSSAHKADPILDYLPHATQYYEVNYAGTTEEKVNGNKKTVLTITIFTDRHSKLYDTAEKRAEYKDEANQWIQSIFLDSSNYIITFGDLEE
jgi:hypothetical protein